MTLGEKLKEMRKKFGLSQEQLSELMNVSRQAITKWENDRGLPDIPNLKQLSNIFGITVDYLLDEKNNLPSLSIRKELDKTKYKNKLTSYEEILKEYYSEPWEIFNLSVSKKMNKTEWILDLFTGGDYNLIKNVKDLSPYYLVKKDNLKLLVNIKDWILKVIELPSNINEKNFVYGENKFVTCGKLKFSK